MTLAMLVVMSDEIAAMGQLDKALTALEPDERARVLSWAVAKFGDGVASVEAPKRQTGGDDERDVGKSAETNKPGFTRISDLMDDARPNSGHDYVLLASYWFQEIQGHDGVTGQQVNSALKDLGHGSANITTAFNALKARKPPLARQIQKSGTSRQARKKYRLTTEGVRAVERMLADGKGDE